MSSSGVESDAKGATGAFFVDKPEQVSFARLLKRLRAASGLTQEGLAERAHLSREGVSALERGGRLYPRLDTVELLAEALGLGDAERAALLNSAARPRRPRAASPEMSDRNSVPFRASPQLPTPPTPLFGRERELEEACQLIVRDSVRLLTLVGPPGVGKTRLALDVAAAAARHFPDGVVFIPLASLAAAELLPDTLVRAIGASAGGEMRALDMLVAHLSDRGVLLVLDNFEHLLGAAPILTQLLMGCPKITLLVTSRAILRVRGERALTVPPLSVPDAPSNADSPAVALFVASAQAVRPEFELTSDNLADVVAICRRLDGLPLALELAAARIRLLPPRALLARLERRLPTLTGGPADVPERHKTLRAALAWSYELLTPDQQLVFRYLSVFSGGATLEAAEAVCAPANAEHWHVLDQLASVVDHGLILPPVDSAAGEPRLGMLETMREFGVEQLTSAGEATAAQHAHATYFLKLAKSGTSALLGSKPSNWLIRLETEVDNLRTALAWSRDHIDQALELALQLCGALGWYWLLAGRLREGRAWCEAILASAAGRGQPVSRGLALLATAMLARSQGDIDVASAYVESAAEIFRSEGQTQYLADALTLLSRIRVYQGDPDAALELIGEIRALLPDGADADARIHHARLGFYEGRALAAKGDLAAASSCYEANVRNLEGIGSHRVRSLLLAALGDLAVATGDEASGYALFEQSLPGLQADHGASQWDLGLLMVNMGFSELRRKNLDRGRQLMRGALRKWVDQGVRAGIGLAMRGLGGVAAGEGDGYHAGLLCAASMLWLSESDAFLLEARGAAAAAARCLAEARARSDANAFDTGWRVGISLTETDAVNLALQRF